MKRRRYQKINEIWSEASKSSIPNNDATGQLQESGPGQPRRLRKSGSAYPTAQHFWIFRCDEACIMNVQDTEAWPA